MIEGFGLREEEKVRGESVSFKLDYKFSLKKVRADW